MWSDGKSIVLSRVCVIVFMLILIAVALAAPWLAHRSAFLRGLGNAQPWFLLTVYAGCVPAAVLLGKLYLLLGRMEADEVFVRRNVDSLRHISWCCFAGAVICAVSGAYYVPWVIVAVAAAFMGLIVRIVKNVFARAVSLQDDADFTI